MGLNQLMWEFFCPVRLTRIESVLRRLCGEASGIRGEHVRICSVQDVEHGIQQAGEILHLGRIVQIHAHSRMQGKQCGW